MAALFRHWAPLGATGPSNGPSPLVLAQRPLLRPEVEADRQRLLAEGNRSASAAETEREALALVNQASTEVNRLFPAGVPAPPPGPKPGA